MDMPPREQMLAELTRLLHDQYRVEVLGSLGFENAYVLVMAGDKARADGVVSIADLAAKAPELTLGSDLEFLSRPEWLVLMNDKSVENEELCAPQGAGSP